mmetsp:Transcript_90928/g.196779  ORF Transcript_90928/g.196779 Transcript_90928/m.196779 type:complete len:555 (-) Transcript_90928:171-1835(-)
MAQPAQDRQELVAIVDPYTSGRFLVDELCQRGWSLVAVRSSLTLSGELISTWNPAPFEHVVVHHGDLADTAARLRSLDRKVRAVVAGCEPGVWLTDALAKELDLRGNDSSEVDPSCRWDKMVMHRRLKECGLQHARSGLVRSVEEALAFARQYEAEGRTWPLICKPCASYGSSNVFNCKDVHALAEAVVKVMGATDGMGRKVEAALVQEFLHGTEYVVDCVSIDGQHFVCATWAYTRVAAVPPARPEATPKASNKCRDCLLGGDNVYDTSVSVAYSNAEGSPQQALYAYVFKCLTALGIRNGASHSEVIYSEDTGPCLIETGARMHGSMGPALWAKCAGKEQSQAFLLADIFCEDGVVLKDKLERVAKGEPAYELAQHSMHIDLQCNVDGVLSKSIDMTVGAWIRSLPTFWMLKFFVEEGDAVEQTQDIYTSPGYVILVGPDKASVERDSEAIRAKELSGEMYEIGVDVNLGLGEEEPMGRGRSLSSFMSHQPSLKRREMDTQMERLLSPLVSRATSPVMSPQQAPALPPGVDDMVEFTLGGDMGDLDDFSLDG